MKNLLYGLLAACCLTLAGQATQSAGAGGTPGVEDGTCWENATDTHTVEVGVVGTVHGDQKITITEGDESGTGLGTPDPDGGCADSEQITVGDQEYRIENGRTEWLNPANDAWVEMHGVKCDADDDDRREITFQ